MAISSFDVLNQFSKEQLIQFIIERDDKIRQQQAKIRHLESILGRYEPD